MNTISDLRRVLGLSTANQVRNRIDAVKDLLAEHLRRGPNNQILVAEPGVEILRRLQDLYDSGLTMTEASEALRSSVLRKETTGDTIMPGIVRNQARPNERDDVVQALRDEIAFLRERVSFLEAHPSRPAADRGSDWWEPLKEESYGA